MELNRVLTSLCRQKILLELSKEKELNIMALVDRTGCKYGEVSRNMHILEES